MTQLVVRVPEDLTRSLDSLAKRMHQRRSDVVRQALRQYVLLDREPVRPTSADLASAERFIGSANSGAPVAAEKHGEYLRATLRKKHRRDIAG